MKDISETPVSEQLKYTQQLQLGLKENLKKGLKYVYTRKLEEVNTIILNCKQRQDYMQGLGTSDQTPIDV